MTTRHNKIWHTWKKVKTNKKLNEAKHTQTNRRQIAHELFECVLRFCEIDA